MTDQFSVNYSDTGLLKINKREVTASGTTTKTYDGTNALLVDVALTLSGVAGNDESGVVEGDDINVSAIAKADARYATANKHENQSLATDNENGLLALTGLTGEDAGNYQLVEVTATGSITAQSITPGPDPDNPDPSYVDVQVDYPADVPYNGQDQTWEPTVTSGETTLVKDQDYTLSYSTEDRTNVTGTITVTITGTGNYTGTVTRTYQVLPLTITVTPDNLSKYVGQADPTLTSTYAGYVQGETAGWTGSLIREPGETAGTYVISQGDLQLADNPDGNFLAQNYNLVVNNGVFTILDAPVTPGGGGGTPTPTPTPTPDGGNPTPVPGAPAVVTTGDDTTDDAADDAAEPEEAIEDDTTPMAGPTETIDDDGTPLADGKHEDCWVHWFILLGMILSAVYFVGVSVRRRKFTSSLLGYEDKVLGNDRDNA